MGSKPMPTRLLSEVARVAERANRCTADKNSVVWKFMSPPKAWLVLDNQWQTKILRDHVKTWNDNKSVHGPQRAFLQLQVFNRDKEAGLDNTKLQILKVMCWNLKGISGSPEKAKKGFPILFGSSPMKHVGVAQPNDFQGQDTASLTHCLLSITAQ
ncbi:hypothetical protein L6452_19844 [Arctium lappa]|uniref:Uncharacterized protein n=1 Tax=Arctium lappa TaxID=4217 RepID=A0ACB9BAL4_ARCLA|nr:hypothetical protein L6452_19844 [Arctium lappa]